jgi:hypothetical protein
MCWHPVERQKLGSFLNPLSFVVESNHRTAYGGRLYTS